MGTCSNGGFSESSGNFFTTSAAMFLGDQNIPMTSIVVGVGFHPSEKDDG